MTAESLKQLALRYRLVLGSGSPRRVRLLGETGVAFEQIIPDVREDHKPGEDPYDFAQRVAGEKALWVAEHADAEAIVLGCDTIVVLGNQLLGKPTDKADALRILTSLSGRQHVVCTGVALTYRGSIAASGYELTKVFFNSVSAQQLEAYIDSGEPMDKAGAYGIQGMGAFLVDRIEGRLDNVIGLPRLLLDNLAERLLVTKQ
ncbi:MAG: Maf family protein [candidate division Zixibacteria bacterium]|nr:Maf family protein [candidate division Zixibacteria bacterium]MDH3936752.1 Maf family protein [candidate division Zixibacteria bacterium]MDH4033015.1 Maf family protein [candidate division Zixibacteria bacterium]